MKILFFIIFIVSFLISGFFILEAFGHVNSEGDLNNFFYLTITLSLASGFRFILLINEEFKSHLGND